MKSKKADRPYKACLGVLAAGMLVLLAGQGFLRAAYPKDAVALHIESGDKSLLDGFTVHGLWKQSTASALAFTLADGVLSEKPLFRTSSYDPLPLLDQYQLCVPDDVMAAVDERAEGGHISGSYGAFFLHTPYEGMQYTAQADTLNQVYTLMVTDGSNRSVRFSLGQTTLPEAVTVTAEVYDKSKAGDSHPYMLNAAEVANDGYDIRDVTILDAEEPVSLYVSPGDGEDGGIYMVRKFCFPEEIEKLVPEVDVQGMPVSSLNQAYGTVEEVCTLEDGETLVPFESWKNARLENGRWILTRSEEGNLILYLLDGEWKSVAKLPLDISLTAGQSAAILPSLRMDEIVFAIKNQEGGGQIIVLRMDQNSIEQQSCLPLTKDSLPITAGFSTDGSRLMVVSEKTERLAGTVPESVIRHYTGADSLAQEIDCSISAVTGWNVQVYSGKENAQPMLSAYLDFGIAQRWKQELWFSKLYGAERTIQLFSVTAAWEQAGEGTA